MKINWNNVEHVKWVCAGVIFGALVLFLTVAHFVYG